MARYVKHFKTESAFNTERNGNYIEPWVSVTDGKGLNYNKSEYQKLLETPLTFEILSDGYINWEKLDDNEKPVGNRTISYIKNDGESIQLTKSTQINVVTGDIVKFFGNASGYAGDKGWAHWGFFNSTCGFNLYGNIMSMINSETYTSLTSFGNNSDYNFISFFSNCSGLVSAKKLILPATTLVSNCYKFMFNGCTNLIAAPALPATTLANNCYNNMFNGCTSLVTAPELPATTLATSCYGSMFEDCTSLVTAPELPATILASSCYGSMFWGCTSLVTAPELPATTLEIACYTNMFNSCSGLVNAPELPAPTMVERCYLRMFEGCTSLVNAPTLQSSTLAVRCYSNMFKNCTSLTTAPNLPAAILVSNCYEYMFYGCSKLNYIWTSNTTEPSSTYTNNWVYGVSSTGTFSKHESSNWDITGNNGIPTGWTVITHSGWVMMPED